MRMKRMDSSYMISMMQRNEQQHMKAQKREKPTDGVDWK